MSQNNYNAIIIGGGQMSGAKAACLVHGNPMGWCKESTFSRLPRTEAGVYPAEYQRKLSPAKVVKLPFYEPEWKRK